MVIHTYTNFEYRDDFIEEFPAVYAPFTNWSAHVIIIWGKVFYSAEHAYQYRKYIETDVSYAYKIKNAKSAYEAKRLAWERKIDTKEWDKIRVNIMTEILVAKLKQHNDVRVALEKTANLAIIQRTNDTGEFWGVGANGKGKDMMGRIWMSLRDGL